MSNWRGGVQPGRCREWETRLVGTARSSTRTMQRQVVCSLPRGHQGAHEWRGVPFGRYTSAGIAASRQRAERSDRTR